MKPHESTLLAETHAAAMAAKAQAAGLQKTFALQGEQILEIKENVATLLERSAGVRRDLDRELAETRARSGYLGTLAGLGSGGLILGLAKLWEILH